MCFICAYVRVWLLIYVLCRLYGLSQNIEFHGHAIPGAVGVARVAIPDDKADAKSPLFRAFAYDLHIRIL